MQFVTAEQSLSSWGRTVYPSYVRIPIVVAQSDEAYGSLEMSPSVRATDARIRIVILVVPMSNMVSIRVGIVVVAGRFKSFNGPLGFHSSAGVLEDKDASWHNIIPRFRGSRYCWRVFPLRIVIGEEECRGEEPQRSEPKEGVRAIVHLQDLPGFCGAAS
jgi:hypothetical protein